MNKKIKDTISLIMANITCAVFIPKIPTLWNNATAAKTSFVANLWFFPVGLIVAVTFYVVLLDYIVLDCYFKKAKRWMIAKKAK